MFSKLPATDNYYDFKYIVIPVDSLVTFVSIINRKPKKSFESIYTKKFIYADMFVYDTSAPRTHPQDYFELILK